MLDPGAHAPVYVLPPLRGFPDRFPESLVRIVFISSPLKGVPASLGPGLRTASGARETETRRNTTVECR